MLILLRIKTLQLVARLVFPIYMNSGLVQPATPLQVMHFDVTIDVHNSSFEILKLGNDDL